MTVIVFVVVTTLATSVYGKVYRLPDNFILGTASSAYQIEGGWNLNGKGENIWDYYTHTQPDKIKDHSTGDVACDSYHRWKEDVKMLKHLRVSFYRFSISWSRILPTGFPNAINPDGVRYYNNLIDELLRNKIEPVVTLFHWDLPRPLQDLGGLANSRIAVYVQDYAEVIFKLFGDRVKRWITFNEPITFCQYGFEDGTFAPGVKSPGIGIYLCGRTLLLGHGLIYRLYEKEFRGKQGGRVGITTNIVWFEPKANTTADIEAQKRILEFFAGWWLNPIFSKEGDYPEIMKKRIAYLSKAENFSESRLPPFSKNEIELIRGSYDFLGLNYYCSRTVEANFTPPYNPPSYSQDTGVNIGTIPNAKKTAASWLQVYAVGLRKLLNYIREKYNNPPVLITENGYPDNGEYCDKDRVYYIRDHLIQVIKAIKDGCDVIGYTYWSLMNSFEWNSGYTLNFGLYKVDFKSVNRTRTPKLSVEYFREVSKHKVVSVDSIDNNS